MTGMYLGAIVGPVAPVVGAMLLFGAVAVFFGLNIFEAAYRGQIRYGPFKYSRDVDPLTFWFLAVIYAFFGVLTGCSTSFLLFKALT